MNAWGEQTAALGETLGAGDRDYNRQIVSSIHSPKGGPERSPSAFGSIRDFRRESEHSTTGVALRGETQT